MQLNKKLIFITLIFYTVFTKNSFAYLDPISGGIILQFIAWIFAGIVSYCVIFWKKIKLFLFFLKNKIKKSK
jgi:hypothetical protein